MSEGPRREDDGLSGEAPPFSDEGARRIVYGRGEGQDGGRRDSRSAAFDDDTAELEAKLGRRRSLVPVVTAVAALFCFGAIVWYAYSWGTGRMDSTELPLVHAEPMPEKVRPEQPGGMDVPHQDKEVLNEGTAVAEAPKVERLLPLPEIPVPPEPLAAPPADPAAEPPEALAAREPAPPPADESPVREPEAPLMAEAAPPAIPADEAEAELEAPLPPEDLAEAEIAKPLPKPRVESPESGDQIAALLEEPPLETANGPSGQVASLAPGDVVIQLSSVRSQAAANQEWGRLQKAHPSLLGPLGLAVETAEVKGTTYYRVQTGPFASRDAATKLCTQLKARNQDCLVKER